MIARVPEQGVHAFAAYEALVLPLLARHGGRLEQRRRNATATLEIHLVSFAGAEALEAFRADPRRVAAGELLRASGAEVTLEAVQDVQDDPGARPAFVFGAMSPYSWIAAERVEALLGPVRWWPVFAGGLFKARGRPSWGLTSERAQKLADSEARAAARGLGPITWPAAWPTLDLKIARALTYAGTMDATRQLALTAMRLAFREGRDLDEANTIADAARAAGLDPSATLAAIEDEAIKQATRAATDEAFAIGVRGIPTLVVDGQLFWGDDRLDEASHVTRARAVAS